MSKRKTKGIAALKKDLWKHFALFIKLKYSSDGQYTECYTCGRSLEIGTSSCHAGHWLTKKGYPVHYFHENNVRPQCYHCNINLSGNTLSFTITDGSDCDVDGLVNGIIQDPVAAGSSVPAGGGDSGGCFINTVALDLF